MNFLAHAYLSFGQEEVLIGNFAADFIKGKEIFKYEGNILIGILLHREIDSYTDSHPLVRAGQTYLRPRFRHYSSVITDIFFDYFLAKNWEKFSSIPMETFVSQTYTSVENHLKILPERFQEMFFWMKSQNWLLHYRELEGIQRTLNGLSRRASFESKMNEAPEILLEKEQEFELIFFAFFEDLRTFATAKLKELEHAHGRH
ncbi:MAG: ACP phosphodiesterase [Cyclobacteriaceae bacterium]|nr:ACP phosphodiesterase [Cyclobacteriaceae bacterium]MDX5467533.1 ACP phosphodiesterase [Cyclobacteriaceae bacterium]